MSYNPNSSQAMDIKQQGCLDYKGGGIKQCLTKRKVGTNEAGVGKAGGTIEDNGLVLADRLDSWMPWGMSFKQAGLSSC